MPSTMISRLVLLTLLLVAPLSAADRVALVIGNNDYPRDGNLQTLRNCVNDARLVRRALETVGFTVTLLENATFSTMDEALLTFENAIPKGSTAVVYFAGHGIEYEGQNYLLGSNAKLQARSRLGEEALKAETFATAMILAGAKSSFLFLDCCRDAPTDAQWLSRGASRKAGLAEINVEGDLMVAFAAAPGKAALEPAEAGANSPYATALAKWIPSGLDHLNFFQEVRKEVNTATAGAQRTWESGSFLEAFYFAAPGKVVTKPAPSPVIPMVEAPIVVTPATATMDRPFENSLGMKFVPVVRYTNGKKVLFSIWETRVQDFQAFRADTEGERDHPVAYVSWEDAQAFCQWLSRREGKTYRLPTDHEWSLAVGIGERESATASPEDKDEKIEGVYPWGTTWPPPNGAGNYSSTLKCDRFDRTSPVGSFSANRFGLYDLGGNVWEWCEDRYSSSSESRVLRGGSWINNDSAYLLSSHRNDDTPTIRNFNNGFRCVLEVGSGG